MSKNTVIEIGNASQIKDTLTEVLREGTRKILQEALEIELEAVLDEYKATRFIDGRQRLVRNGYHKSRRVQTGIGEVEARVPRMRDRFEGGEKIVYQSRILPPYLRRSKSIESLLPWLSLKGISTGDFPEALESLLGRGAKGLSQSTISRLKECWEREHEEWAQRDLSEKHYVYFWVDGIYSNVRMDEAKQCLLVIVGATDDGKKELVALEDGYRENEQSWKEVLEKLKRQGLQEWPSVVTGDGAMGFWTAFRKICTSTREQRCWVHKTGNILNKLPKSIQASIWKNIRGRSQISQIRF